MKKQDFTVLKIADLHPFPDNPFHLVEDELLMELSESIKEFGVVTPIITRPKEDGNGYEVIAGQRRVRASQLAGIETIPAFVLPLDRDRAIITLVDSNIQRETVKIGMDKLRKYFPRGTTPKLMEDYIIRLLERELQRKRNRDSR